MRQSLLMKFLEEGEKCKIPRGRKGMKDIAICSNEQMFQGFITETKPAGGRKEYSRPRRSFCRHQYDEGAHCKMSLSAY